MVNSRSINSFRVRAMTRNLFVEAEQLVKQAMAEYDSSHDWYHVDRVRNQGLGSAISIDCLALRIAELHRDTSFNDCSIDMLVVELSALFHDLFDRKYKAIDGGRLTEDDLYSWLIERNISQVQSSLILRIISNVSYSKEVELKKSGGWTEWHASCVELHCVMDADKLDALGAFGIFRCAAFSGNRNIPLYVSEDDELYRNSAVGHFDGKLFKLENMMVTSAGQRVAAARTAVMRSFIEQLHVEAQRLDI